MCRDAHVKTPHVEDKHYLPGFGFMNNVFFLFIFFACAKVHKYSQKHKYRAIQI